MTATSVDGVEVVASEQAPSALPQTNGKPVMLKQTLKLLLADGREVFGCVHCDYTAEKSSSIYPHLKKHSERVRREPVATIPEDMTIGELFGQYQRAEALADQLDRMIDNRNEWKARAQDAESSLNALRRALKGVAL